MVLVRKKSWRIQTAGMTMSGEAVIVPGIKRF